MKRILHNNLLLIAALLITQFANAQYCTPGYTVGTSDGDYIDGVQLGTIDNTGTGGSGGYADYTGMSTTLSLGTSYAITLTNTPSFGEFYTVWIDYNADMSFTSDEVIFEQNLIASATVTGSFSVPITAVVGTTRMRVMCVYAAFSPLDPCGTTYTFW